MGNYKYPSLKKEKIRVARRKIYLCINVQMIMNPKLKPNLMIKVNLKIFKMVLVWFI